MIFICQLKIFDPVIVDKKSKESCKPTKEGLSSILKKNYS